MPCNERGERKPFLGLLLLLTILIWGPISFDLTLDLPNPQPCAPHGAHHRLDSSGGPTARCVVVFRRVPGEHIPFHLPRDELPSDFPEMTLQKRPSSVYLTNKQTKSCNCLSSQWDALEESQPIFRQRIKAFGQTRCKQRENMQFPFPHSLRSSLVQDLFHFLIHCLLSRALASVSFITETAIWRDSKTRR